MAFATNPIDHVRTYFEDRKVAANRFLSTLASPTHSNMRKPLLSPRGLPRTSASSSPTTVGKACGTPAGHLEPGGRFVVRKQCVHQPFGSWGGEDLNLRPTDYESVPGPSADLRKSVKSASERAS